VDANPDITVRSEIPRSEIPRTEGPRKDA